MALLMCLALALGVCPAFSLAEAVATELTEPGQTAEAVFMVSANPNHAVGAMLELEYDHTALTLIPNDTFRTDRVAISDLSGIPVGKKMRAVFRLADHAQAGVDYQVRLNMKEAYDINENAVQGLELSDYTISYAMPASEKIFGMGMTAAELDAYLNALYADAKLWHQGTEPQTLSEFQYLPEELLQLFLNLDQATSELKQVDDSNWVWETNTWDSLEGWNPQSEFQHWSWLGSTMQIDTEMKTSDHRSFQFSPRKGTSMQGTSAISWGGQIDCVGGLEWNQGVNSLYWVRNGIVDQSQGTYHMDFFCDKGLVSWNYKTDFGGTDPDALSIEISSYDEGWSITLVYNLSTGKLRRTLKF